MRISQYLLVKLMQEASELAQAASKIIEHGEDARNPHSDVQVNNIHDLYLEMLDVMAVYQMYIQTQKDTDTWKRLFPEDIETRIETDDLLVHAKQIRVSSMIRILQANGVIEHENQK